MKKHKGNLKSKDINANHRVFIINKNSGSGITLIALIVTIIVLLILAGVSIGAMTDKKGLINEAKESKKSSEKFGVEEQITKAITKTEEEYINPTLDNIIDKLKEEGIIDSSNQVDTSTGTVKINDDYIFEGILSDYITDDD